MSITLASWNVNSLNVRLPQVQEWLSLNTVDILGLQELKLIDAKFPFDAFASQQFDAIAFGQPTYNGVALIHKGAAKDVVRNIPSFEDPQSRVISATIDSELGEVRVINAYFVNGQEPGSEKFAYKILWLQHLQKYLKEQLQEHQNVVLMGDFNITADDRDTWDPEGLRDTIHHTKEEREALAEIFSLGFIDCFRQYEQVEKSFSWWDYRMLGFQKNRGLRIDYVLISNALQPYLRRCWIDRTPRKWPKPSDHAPVLIELSKDN